MPHSAVTQITFQDGGTITLQITVPNWQAGLPIEISGQATQTQEKNGVVTVAVATFYTVKEMTASGVIEVSDVVAVLPNRFEAGSPITVVARASEAWVSTLQMDTTVTPGSDPTYALSKANWAVAWKGQTAAAYWPSANEQTPSPTTLLRHGTWWDRGGADPLYAVMEGRFTRLFPELPGARFDPDELEQLAGEMIAPPEKPEQEAKDGPDPEENPDIPAAYTYLGQFIDHDLTFDPISHLRRALTPAQLHALVDFRTPRFDLDSLYGRGPDDQPYMYEDDGIRLRLGEPMSGHLFDAGAVQIPRGPGGRALIGDPRNDENRIVAQLHAIFLRFHNEVVRTLGGTNHVSFEQVRDQVRWHYQWVLVDDFLRTIVDEETYKSVILDHYNFVTAIPRLRENDLELMPVEFSVAAYRFGHSMIRQQYRLNPTIERPIPIFSDHPDDVTADLGGFRPIPANWAIDWQFFINLGHDSEREPQLSYKIDTSLVHPLGNLPERVAKDPSSLALRNLQRGLTFQLPSGQQVAKALGITSVADEDLMIGKATAEGPQKPIAEVGDSFVGNTPLWVYILSEAQASWNAHSGPTQDETPVKLGPLGGRLVAEVFASLLRGDHTSYLYAEPTFTPIRDFAPNKTFGLAELINVALGHTR
jgi:hypothetical protein